MAWEPLRKLTSVFAFALAPLASCTATAEWPWPVSNDPAFDATVRAPAHPEGQGPRILLDGAHHNFFVQWDFIRPFADLAAADGCRPVVGDQPFTSAYLAGFDLVVVVTALPFDFTTKAAVTTESTFADAELDALHAWVVAGGALLVFSEHAPFDQAINPLLQRFGISSSVGTVIDPEQHDRAFGRPDWIVFSRDNGYLNPDHPITRGRNTDEAIGSVITFDGSSLRGDAFTNLLRLSPAATNTRHATGVGPVGMGDSQALAGYVGEGRIVALGDSNGFTAMSFKSPDGAVIAVGMHTARRDWKQFVLNTLRWLSGALPEE
jgi:hypothetical protein